MSRVRKGACGARKNTKLKGGANTSWTHLPFPRRPNAKTFAARFISRTFFVETVNNASFWWAVAVGHRGFWSIFALLSPSRGAVAPELPSGFMPCSQRALCSPLGRAIPLSRPKLMVGISVALQFGHFFSPLLHADGGDARSGGAQFRSGSLIGCIWRLMSARGGSRGSCCRVLACFPD